MKILLVFLIVQTLILSTFETKIKLKGQLCDISQDELKVLYLYKSDYSKESSQGSLFVYDLQSNKTKEIVHFSPFYYEQYGLESFFLNNDTILIIRGTVIALFDLITNKCTPLSLPVNSNEVIVASDRLNDTTFLITSCDFDKSKISLVKLNSRNLKMIKVISIDIKIIPTDNFFKLFLLNNVVLVFDNLSLYQHNHMNTKILNQEIAYNDYGEYLMANNENSLCYVRKETNKFQFVWVYKNLMDQHVLNIPILDPSQTFIKSFENNNEKMFTIFNNNKSYVISKEGAIKQVDKPIRFIGKYLNIFQNDVFEFELSIKN